MLTAYATILVFVLVAVAFVLGSMLAGRIVRPRPPASSLGRKLDAYESGEEPIQTAWFNFNPRFYLAALVFLIFDVEIAFVLPVAVVLKRWVAIGRAEAGGHGIGVMGVRALTEVLGFMIVLLLGLAYAWKKGDLDWIRTVGGAVPAGAPLPVTASRAGEIARRDGEASAESPHP